MGDKWDKKIHRIRENYPEVQYIDWSSILNEEPDVFRSILGGVVKSDISKKTKLDNSLGAQKLAQLHKLDYSEVAFVEALEILWGDRSISDMVHKTKLSKAIIYGLKRGIKEPTFEEMEQIARSFGKDPSFFLEYRIGKVLAAIDQFLISSPETASAWYLKTVKNEGLKIK